MAFLYTDPKILATLRGDESHPIFTFVEIYYKSSTEGLFITTAPYDVDDVADINGSWQTWDSSLLKGVSTPARTGNVTQEIQRVELVNPLDYQFATASNDLGAELDKYTIHNKRVVISSYLFDSDTFQFITSEPIVRSDGIIKSRSEDTREGTIILEVSNSFGKLDGLKELRTNPSSLKRRSPDDTCFDKAGKSIDRISVQWGVGA